LVSITFLFSLSFPTSKTADEEAVVLK
jgi:hypothetical protein